MDIRTLYLAAMVVWLISTCSLSIIWKIRKTYPGFGYWVLFSSGMTVGCIFLTHHDSLPQFIPILIGNGFLLVSVLWALQGVRTFYGTGHVRLGYWIALALVESGLAWFVYVTPNISVRVLLVSFFLGIVSIIIAWELIFNTPIEFRTSSRFFGVVVFGNGLFFIFRGFATVLWAPLPTFFSPSSIQVVTLFAAMAVSMLSAFGVIMLNSQRGEVELRKSEDRLKRSQEIAHLGSWELDLVQNRLMWSDEVYHIFGLQPQEFGATYEAFLDRVYPDDRASVDAAYSGSLRENRDTYEIEHRVVRKDNGEIRIVHEKCEHIRNATGKIIRSIGMVHDITERKRTEEALKESERNFRRIFDQSPIATAIAIDGHFTRVNRAMCSMLGYTEEEFVSLRFADITHPDHLDTDREEVKRLISGEIEEYITEKKYLRKDGSILWGQLSLRAIRDASGHYLYSLPMVVDITERKRTEEALRESEEKYRLVLENVNEAIFIAQEGMLKYVNPATIRLVDYPKEVVLSKPFTEFVHPEDRSMVLERHLKRLRGEKVPSVYSFRIIASNSTPRWVQVHATRIEWEGRPATINFLIDITERTQAEEALQKSEEKFRFITERMSDVVWTLDANMRVQYVSPSISKALGFTPEERIKQALVERITPESLKKVQEVLELEMRHERESSVDSDRSITLELEYYHKDCSTVWHETVVSGIRDAEGNIIGFHGASRDITERKRLEERLRRSEKMEVLGTLAGGVAHDLNNVLGVLIGYSELLLEKVQDGNPLRNYVTNIFQSAQKGAAIVKDLLTLARRGVAVSEVVNLNRVISDYLNTPEFEKLKVHHSYVTFKVSLGENLMNIKGSPVHLEKTIMNLVSNASEAISNQGEVTIRTENRYIDKPIRDCDDVREGDYVVLTVSDNGKGILSSDLEKIFEPFYTKKVMGRSGTGLGLTVVWGTVKDHGGYIDVRSEAGQGSTFMIYLPATREELMGNQQKISPDEYMGRGESILVVDDVKEQREVATSMLTRLGYKVHSASSGEDAVEYLKTNKVDLLVLDMIMNPGIDGLETYQRVLEINPRQKAIIVSGFSESDRVKKALELGAGAYVSKPYVLEKIGMAVKKNLEKE